MIANSTDVIISDMDLKAQVRQFVGSHPDQGGANTVLTQMNQSQNGVKIANSDGWDTYRSDRIVIQNSVIINTDGEFGNG